MKLTKRLLNRDERTFEVTLERRADDEKPLRIIGHPVVYDRWSQDLGGFRERVLPGAATKTLGEADIRGLLNHDPNFVLGRNKAGTMVLSEDGKGVRMELFPPDTPTVRDLVITPMERGDLTQMSFAFRTVNDEWREPGDPGIVKKDGLWERDLIEFQMWDASVVTFPAYTQTDAAVRSVLTDAGIPLDALSALLVRADRGVPLTDSDADLLSVSIETLRSYLPTEPEPSATTPPEPQAGPSVAHLRRLLDLRERELALI